MTAWSADRAEPIELGARRLEIPWRGDPLPVVEYVHPELEQQEAAATVLFLAGGGSSGLVMARVAALCAERAVRVVMFDQPGHTPVGLLGEETPEARLVRRAGPRARRHVIDTMLGRWQERCGDQPLAVAAHSAGFMDAGRLDPARARHVQRFVVLGASLPSFRKLRETWRRSRELGLESELDPSTLWRLHALQTGQLPLHFGPSERFAVPAEILEGTQSLEHVGVVLQLMRRSAFGLALWRGRGVDLLLSDGDLVVPVASGRESVAALGAAGARALLHVLPGELPHMFMMFEAGARRTCELLCAAVGDGPGARRTDDGEPDAS